MNNQADNNNNSLGLPLGIVPSSQVTVKYSEGPLPNPDAFERYEQILPGAAERILKMAEEEQLQRHRIENEYAQATLENVRLEHIDIARGQTYALIVALFMLAVSGYLIYEGHPLSGTLLGGSTLAMIVASFVKSWQRSPLQN